MMDTKKNEIILSHVKDLSERAGERMAEIVFGSTLRVLGTLVLCATCAWCCVISFLIGLTGKNTHGIGGTL